MDIEDDVEDMDLLSSPAPPIKEGPISPPRPIRSQFSFSSINVWDYPNELGFITFLFVYIACHLYGRSRQLEIARSWMGKTLHLWKYNFAHVGDEKGYTLIRDGPKDFIFYASGRIYFENVYGYIKVQYYKRSYYHLNTKFSIYFIY